MEETNDLIHVTLFALEHDDFRQAWDAAVRETADRATATVVGRVMGGATHGQVVFCQESTRVPIPADLGLERTQAAFQLAVAGEVGRRLHAMTSPGAFG